jgi:RHS repeat-associated protein
MVLNDGELKKIRHSYGQIREIDGEFEPVFHIADHGSTALTINLGSPRVIFWDEDGDGVVREDEVLERIDYYPFGLEHGRPVDHPEDMESHFRYTDQEHGPSGVPYYDYVSRLYDPALGRFLGVDDMAGHIKQLGMSPYSAMWNNPLRWRDPDGRCPSCPDGAEMGDIHFWGGSKFKFDGDAWVHTLDAVVVRGFDFDNTQPSDFGAVISMEEFNRTGVVFTAGIGGNNEDKRGKAWAYVNIDDLFTILNFQRSFGNVNPRNHRGLFAKLGNIFTAGDVGNELRNRYNWDAMDITEKEPFDRNLPVYMQTSRETRRQAMEQYRNSQDYMINMQSVGIDTFYGNIIDTIVPVFHERKSGRTNSSTMWFGPPSLNKN